MSFKERIVHADDGKSFYATVYTHMSVVVLLCIKVPDDGDVRSTGKTNQQSSSNSP